MLQGPSDDFLGPRDAAVFDRADQGIDVEWGLAVVSADVAQGSAPDAALESVRLLMLVNAWCLRDAAAGLHRRPAVACGPVAVTPDEPGRAWAAGRLRLDLACWRNGALLGRAQTGRGDGFHFGELISHAAQTRRLRAGGIVGALAPACSEGVSCIAQQRDAESEGGEAPRTPYLQTGDTLRVEALARDGASIFGAIEQTVTAAAADQA
jgi:fumarylacetoacetate (FAA) hydrolase